MLDGFTWAQIATHTFSDISQKDWFYGQQTPCNMEGPCWVWGEGGGVGFCDAVAETVAEAPLLPYNARTLLPKHCND